MANKNTIIVEIECLPSPYTDDTINKCIEAIKKSGLKHEVHAMGTLIEGSPDKVWPLLRQVHEVTMSNGAENVTTMIKVSQSTSGDTMDERMRRVR